MKKAIIVVLLLLFGVTVGSARGLGFSLRGTGSNPHDHYVHSYVRRDGTFVSGHWQTNPNNTQLDNYGTLGNVNPHNGKVGTKIPQY